MVPALRPGYAAMAAIEADCFDIDVAALHQGFLRQARAAGGTLALRSRAGRIWREDGAWHAETSHRRHLHRPRHRQRRRRLGRRGRAHRRPRPDRVAAQAPHRLHRRPGRLRLRRLAAARRCRPWLVRPRRGTAQADGQSRRRDRQRPLRRAARRIRRRGRDRPHAAGTRHPGRAHRAPLGRAADLHARPRPGGRRRAPSAASSGWSARAATACRPRRPPGALLAALVDGRDPGALAAAVPLCDPLRFARQAAA